jgi:hypothetical protein
MVELETLERKLREDGVVVLENVYTEDQFTAITGRYQELYQEFLSALPGAAWKTNRFVRTDTPTFKLDKKLYHDVPMAPWGSDGIIVHMGAGRYDFSSREKFEQGALGSVWFRYPSPVRALVERLLVGDFRDAVGALPSNAQSATGRWHRDIYASLPPFYLTMLVPLVELTAENGATEFILGSHRQTLAQAVEGGERSRTAPKRTFLAEARPRGVVLFDGRIIHRGGPNSTSEERPVLYQTFTKRWYYDLGQEEPNTLERAEPAKSG